MDARDVHQMLMEAFAPILGTDEDFEVVDDGDDLEVVTPDWTVRIEGWSGSPVGWVLLKNWPPEGTPPAEAREAVMGYEIDEAFADVDLRIGGRISAALKAGGDAVSLSLLESMAEIEERLSSVN